MARSGKRAAGVLFAAGMALAGPPLAGQEKPAGTIVLSLEDALRIAAGESETVWVAEAGRLQALGNERIARSQYFPQVEGSAVYTRTLRSQFSGLDFGGGSQGGGQEGGNDALQDLPFGRENQYSLGLTLNQTVFDGGQTAARNRAAQALRRSAEVGVESAEAQTLVDVTSAYFEARLADRLVEIAESSLGQTEEVLRQTEVALRVGDRSEFELLRARVARDNQLPSLIRRRSERTQSYLRLKQLLNVPLENELALTTGVEDEIPRFATVSDPSPEARAPVRQATENVRASEAELAETRAQRLPAVSLSSRYAPVAYPQSGFPGFSDFREDWTVSLSLFVPLLTWGRQAGAEQAARGSLSEARARLQQTRETAELEARLAQSDLADAQATLAANTSTSDEARRAYSIAQIRFREGIASQIELSDSRLLLEQADVNRALALRDVQVARARLALLEDLPLFTVARAALAISQPVTTTRPLLTTNTAPAAGTSFPGGLTGGTVLGNPIP